MVVDAPVNSYPYVNKVLVSGGKCLLVGIDIHINVYTSHAMEIMGHSWRDTWLRGRLRRVIYKLIPSRALKQKPV